MAPDDDMIGKPRRIATVTQLRPEKADEYLSLHRAVWPEVLATLKRAKISNYSIFLRDGFLFSYLEYWGDDYAADSAMIAADNVTQDWWRLTGPCQISLPTANEGQKWAAAEEVFHLD
jgi:L-rhamnose mutarotase